MKYKKFKKLAEKHLFILEGYTYDKNGNKEKQIYGLEELYKQLTLTDVGKSFYCENIDNPLELCEKQCTICLHEENNNQ